MKLASVSVHLLRDPGLKHLPLPVRFWLHQGAWMSNPPRGWGEEGLLRGAHIPVGNLQLTNISSARSGSPCCFMQTSFHLTTAASSPMSSSVLSMCSFHL